MHIVALLFPAAGCLIPLLAGVFLFRLGGTYRRKYQLLGQTPVAPIGTIAPGFVHLRGTVACQEPLVSPLTQMPCCYYLTSIARLTRYTQGVATQKTYTTIYSEPSAKAFYLDDGTGKVQVDPHGAEYDVPQTFVTYVNTDKPGLTGTVMDSSVSNGTPSEQRLRDYIAKHASDPAGRVHVAGNPALEQRIADAMAAEATSYRLTEHCLLDKQACSVLGTCDGSSTSANAAARLVHKGTAQPSFVITSRTDQQEAGRWRMRAMGAMVGGAALVALGGIGLLTLIVAAL